MQTHFSQQFYGKGENEAKPLPLIGRFGTSLKIGIVGLPNIGKSTFFNVLTKSQAAAEHFPFCTIDPNESRVPIPDERYDFLCQFHKPPSKVPAFLNVVDIAGLVKGAHASQGLGNAFLSHFCSCDGIFHLTRICSLALSLEWDGGAFEDEDIIHVEGTVDPVRNMEIIREELRLKDEEMIGPIIDKLEKMAIRGSDKKLKPEYQKHCTEHKTQSALSRIIKAGYAALLLEYFFTTGPDEVRAWTVRKGTKAPQDAEKIHTDFEKGFIMAEVMKFQDFKEEGSENAVKAAGKYRQRGRNYEDGDIIFFKFNTPNAQKKK
ncbi:hypothetical protein KUCAC02_010162 [Chaenocephalus aceratus]|uniref:Uncharacterized protein n=1 Tax=Chaenocephalus aceratus TaxID=36190 RepID=A0ACB9VYP0_CHAAC|nr:hypothetical protein KUCAC02_010162 [Chaenocephalus aceratus]